MGLIQRNAVTFVAGCALLASPALGQEADKGPAIGSDLFISTDSDDTTVIRLAGDFDLRNDGDSRRLGLRIENAWYKLLDRPTEQRQRAFLQAGDKISGWTWAARIGSDGDSVIGAASIHDDARFRKEFFIERDIVETPLGLERELYSTFAGAAVDLPVDDRNVFTAMAGLQEFTGKNERYHLRGSYIHVLKPDWGLSAQLRGRYFHSTRPGEFDYYSPRNFVQVLPALQVRRFMEGWRLRAVGGIGAQRDSNSGWNRANFAQFQVDSPTDSPWTVGAELTFTNTPSSSAIAADGYSYFQSRISVRRRF